MSNEFYIFIVLTAFILIREYRARGIDGALNFLIDALQKKGHDVKELAQKSTSSKTQVILINKAKEAEVKEEKKDETK